MPLRRKDYPPAHSYSGRRQPPGTPGGRCVVLRHHGQYDTALDPRFDLWNHSPTGFEWGYGGSGPAQLALALLADATGDDEIALALYQTFKWNLVAALQKEEWRLDRQQVLAWVANHNEDLADRQHGAPARVADDEVLIDEARKEADSGVNLGQELDLVDVIDGLGDLRAQHVTRDCAERLLVNHPTWYIIEQA